MGRNQNFEVQKICAKNVKKSYFFKVASNNRQIIITSIFYLQNSITSKNNIFG